MSGPIVHHMPGVVCPVCQATFPGVAPAGKDPKPPSAGDLAICLECTAALRFNADLVPSRLTAADMAALERDTLADLCKALTLATHIKRTRRAGDA